MTGVGEGLLISAILSCFVLYKLLAIDKFYLQSPVWDTKKSAFHSRRFSVVNQNESLN